MSIEYSKGAKTTTATTKVLLSALVGLAGLFVGGKLLTWTVAPLIAWDTAALVFAIWIWKTVLPLNEELTARHAVREDPSRALADVLVLFASIVSLVAVGIVLLSSANHNRTDQVLLVALGIVSVVISWVVVHTIFALHYAELYYKGSVGGVEFPDTAEPIYSDFAYLAFTIGMTFQVSDTGFKTNAFRKTALRHALFSYMFGTVIVAMTINLVAGLIK